MGIAWEKENAYWAFDGSDSSIVRYDFVDDHGAGYDDHSDGIIARYVMGSVSRVADVPSHMVFDQDTALLYIADTGNNRIAVLDTTSGNRGNNLPMSESVAAHYRVIDADMWTLLEGEKVGMSQPSGLALVEETLLVTDHDTGYIFAFSLEGELLDWLDTELGSEALMGITARSLEDVWLVNARRNEVLRLRP